MLDEGGPRYGTRASCITVDVHFTCIQATVAGVMPRSMKSLIVQDMLAVVEVNHLNQHSG